MSLADNIFIQNCKDILAYGTDLTGEQVRDCWDDGTPAYTKELFGVVNRYDLRKEFPAITLRPTAIKSAMDEILWIYQKKSNNVNDLNSHIWDKWADSDGSIGKSYGYQVAKKHKSISGTYSADYIMSHKSMFSPNIVKQTTDEFLRQTKVHGNNARVEVSTLEYFDQMDSVLNELVRNPFSRRHIISLWSVDELAEMKLEPCCWSVNFVVTVEDGQKVLNMALQQRSADMLTANNWNVVQYAILLMMVAQSVGMIAGEMIHTIANAHIYDRHIPMVEELIHREQYPAPIVELNPEITDFYQFTTKDISVTNYQAGEQIKNIPVSA